MTPVLGLFLSNLFGRVFAFFMVVCIPLLSSMEYGPSGPGGARVEFDVDVLALFGLRFPGGSATILGWSFI